MKIKFSILCILTLCLTLLQASIPAFAQEKPAVEEVYTYYVKQEQSNSAKELSIFLARYLNTLNTHEIKEIGDYYASNFISGDGFNKAQIIDLTKQTWEKFPDINYSTIIKNMRLDENRASIEFSEAITATTKDKSDITKDKGNVTGTSHNILYLEKYGSGWKIVTDKTLYEEITIKYGKAKDINVKLDTPEQVLSGEDYTASLKTELPADVFALGSLASVPLVYPAKQPEETFRQIPSDLNMLERLIKANKNNYNEVVSASISFCEAAKESYTSLDLKVGGLTVILRRVNVAPKQ